MRSLKLSWAGGEVSPEMVGRLDARQHQNGAAKVQNYLPLPQGPVTRRPGSRWVADEYSVDRDMGTSGWDLGAETATFLEPHGFVDDDAITFKVAAGGALPTGFTSGQTVYVIVVDSYTIQVSFAPGSGIALFLGGSPSGQTSASLVKSKMHLFPFVYSTDQAMVIEARNGLFRFFTDGKQLLYATPRNMGVAGWDLTANTATFLEEHGFEDGDAIIFTVPDGDALPTGFVLGQTVYVMVVDSYTIQVSFAASPLIALFLGGSPTGYTRAFFDSSHPTDDHPADWVSSTTDPLKEYKQGDLMYWFGGGSLADGVYYCKNDHTPHASDPFNDTANWFALPNDGQLLVPTPYQEADLPALHYAQSNDVVTLVHSGYAPRELRRLGATTWDLRAIAFGSTLTVPTGLAVTEDRGARLKFDRASPGSPAPNGDYRFAAEHNLAKGDVIYNDGVNQSVGLVTDEYYIVNKVVSNDMVQLTTMGGDVAQWTGANTTLVGTAYYASLSAANEQTYKITAVDANDIETTASGTAVAENNLDVEGASNALTWTAVTGAQKYRVYREENGLYGYIGESDTEAFTDDGIDADLSRTPPIEDDDLSGSDYPRAAGYFEQRRCFAGTVANPRNLWMTKSGTESDMTYSLPIKDDDRISVALAAREAATIRHIVPMADLLLMTQQGEWRVTAVNSDAITPETIAVRQQSEIGCSDVRPLVVNNTVVFAANRGGHVRTMSYNWQAQGYATGDLSLRATHLFDGLTLEDSTYSKAPYPVLWFVSSSGKLLSLTYVPEEEVAGWAVHDLGEGAVVESVCAIPEGDQDSVYLMVKRTVNGTESRYLERLVPQVTESLTDSVYLDASVTYDGLETAGRSITLTGGSRWDAGETVTITASSHLFKDRTEVGDEIELRDSSGGKYRVRISEYVSSTVATGVLVHDVPTAMQRTSVTTWAFARKAMTGLSHLEGETVSIVADGAVLAPQVVTSGAITLPVAAAKAHVGRNFTSELRTLPLTMQQVDGAGQGRTKNVATAYLRVLESAGMKVGPDTVNLVPVEGMDATKLTTGEQRAVPKGAWTQGGEFVIRQDQPLPSTVLGLTLDVELGG